MTDHDIMRICDNLDNGNLTDAGVAMRDCDEPHRVTLAVVSRQIAGGIDTTPSDHMTQVARAFNAADRYHPKES